MITTEDFTDRSRRIMKAAQDYACEWSSAGVDTGHLLFALLHSDRACIPLTALSNLKIDIDALSTAVEKAVRGCGEMVPEGTIPGHTPQLLVVIARARRAAKAIGHPYIGAEHLMIGLLAQAGTIAHTILVGVDAPIERIIDEIFDLLGAPRLEAPQAASTGPLNTRDTRAATGSEAGAQITDANRDLYTAIGMFRDQMPGEAVKEFQRIARLASPPLHDAGVSQGGYKAKIGAHDLIPYPADAPAAGSRWKHFKGDEIPVHFMARHSETKEPLVIYEHLGGRWARPLSMWHEEARPGIKRFTLEKGTFIATASPPPPRRFRCPQCGCEGDEGNLPAITVTLQDYAGKYCMLCYGAWLEANIPRLQVVPPGA